MTHTIDLNPKKVLRQFGPRPWLGKAMPCLPKIMVPAWTNQWGKLKRKPAQLAVPRRVALQHLVGNTWRVICEDAHWPAVRYWLQENCK